MKQLIIALALVLGINVNKPEVNHSKREIKRMRKVHHKQSLTSTEIYW